MLYSTDKYGNIFYCSLRGTRYDTLLLSGGSLKCIYLLGILHTLQRHLTAVTSYVGVSSGAIVCFFLTLGYTPYEIFIKIIRHYSIPFNNKSFFKSDFIYDAVRKATLECKIDPSITFEEHYKITGVRLVVCAFNLTTCKSEIFSYQETPTVSCIKALELSSNLPFIFETKKLRHNIYLDGGFYNNFPVELACEISGKDDKILALTTLYGRYDNYTPKTRYNLHVLMANDCEPSLYLRASTEDKYIMFIKGSNVHTGLRRSKRRNSI